MHSVTWGRALPALAVTAFLFASPAADAAARNGTGTPAVAPGATVSGNFLAARHARIALEEGDAADFLLAALRQAPDDPVLLGRAVPALLLAGRVKEAVGIAERAAAVGAQGPAQLTLAVGEIREQRYGQAMERLAALPAAPHTDPLVVLLSAWCEFGLNRVDDGLARLAASEGKRQQAVLAALHRAWLLAAAGRHEAAASAVDAVLAEHKEPWLRLVELAGGIFERAGRRADALALYRDYEQRHPDSQMLAAAVARAAAGGSPPPFPLGTAQDGAAEALFDGAALLSRHNNRETALIFGRLALYLKPHHPPLQMVVGDLLDDFGRYRDANAVYAAVDRGSPFAWPARLAIARNLDRLDRAAEAERMLREMANERPASIEAIVELADFYRRRERYGEAVAAYDEAFARIPELAPRHWRLLYARGIALERSKDWPRAEADFLKALAFEPDQPSVLNYLGYSWVEQGQRLEEAEAMIRKAVALRPNDGHIVDSLGWVLFRLGRIEEAVSQLERAVELRPEDPIITDHLADALAAAGRQREARFQWQAALRLDPEPELRAQIEAKLGLSPKAQAASGGE